MSDFTGEPSFTTSNLMNKLQPLPMHLEQEPRPHCFSAVLGKDLQLLGHALLWRSGQVHNSETLLPTPAKMQ